MMMQTTARKRYREVTVIGERMLSAEEAKRVRAEISESFRARAAARVQERVVRLPDAPERRSVAVAKLAVEIRLVKAFWTIARQPLGAASPMDDRRCGIDYIHDSSDTHARYTDAPSGKWEAVAPRPSLPSSKDIDQANAALDWLLLIDDEKLRKMLVMGATSKRGDVGRRINWIRLRVGLPEYASMTIRTMQRRYQEALRIIVTELTIARMSSLSHTAR